MRMLLPGVRLRRKVDAALVRFFADYQDADFDAAVGALCAFYETPRPRIEWYRYLGGGQTLGETLDDGRVNLLHPEDFKRRKSQNTAREWNRTFYHEWAHYLLWSGAERKADLYARRFVEGLK